jgi:hypothetical protein
MASPLDKSRVTAMTKLLPYYITEFFTVVKSVIVQTGQSLLT